MARSGWNLKREKILSRDEVKRVLDLARKGDERDYLIFAIAANVALRVSEILHIRTSDVRADSIRVTRLKKKTRDAEDVPISEGLGKLLLESDLYRLNKKRDGWLFKGYASPCRKKGVTLCDGGHVCKREIQRRWKLYLSTAKLDANGRGIHTLRHYAITEFYDRHRDLRATQEFVQHSSSAITETYAHVREMREKILAVKPTL